MLFDQNMIIDATRPMRRPFSTRLDVPAGRWGALPAGLKLARIDIDPSEMRRLTPDAAVISDAQAGTRELLAAVRKAGYAKTSGRRASIRGLPLSSSIAR